MKKKELPKEQSDFVSCPTCGVGVGEPCVWNYGELRLGPHLNRKLTALEFIERGKQIDKSDSAQPADATATSARSRSIPLR
jgi:hypothetical protein